MLFRSPRALAKRFGVPKHQRQQFEDLLRELAAGGKVKAERDGRVGNVDALQAARSGFLRGIIRINDRGGWFSPHPDDDTTRDVFTYERGDNDIFIFPESLADAHDGDEVLVKPSRQRAARGRRTGSVEKIVKRKTTSFVGSYFEEHHRSYVRVDGKSFDAPIYVDRKSTRLNSSH